MRYRADIDGLRAVAIILVVAFHVGIGGFDGGFIGVDVFFVLSGFLITGLLVGELETRGRISWLDFYARRIRRLLPAMTVVLLCTLLLGCFLLVPDPELRWLAQSVGATVAFVSNVFFYLKLGGYFSGAAEEQPLLNTWSLAVEEQFYVLWPVALGLTWWAAKRIGRDARAAVALMMVAAIAVSLAISEHLVRSNGRAAFYLMPSRLWELAIGGLLSISFLRLRPTSRRVGATVAVAGLTLIVTSLIVLDGGASFPGVSAVPVVVGTAMVVLGSGSKERNVVTAVLSTRWLVTIGRLSYSWYLIHWPLLAFARVSSLERNVWRDALISLLSLGLAALMYRFVEEPCRHQRVRLTAGNRTSVKAGLAVAGLVGVLAGIVLVDTDRASFLPASDAQLNALAQNRTARNACPNRATGAPEAVDCVFMISGSDTTLVLAGDSHALAVLPLAREVAADLGWNLEVLWDTGCPFNGPYEAPVGARPLPNGCDEENRVRVAYLQEHEDRFGGVIISGRVTSLVNHPEPGVTTAAAVAWASALRAALDDLGRRGVPVVLLQEVPRLPHPVPQCLIRKDASECEEETVVAAGYRRDLANAQSSISLDSVLVLDPFERLCPGDRCIVEIDDSVLYRDRDHLSESGAAYLADAVLPEIERHLVG